MDYKTLLSKPKGQHISHYMRDIGMTGENLTSDKGLNFIHIKLNVEIHDGKYKKTPCYIRDSGIELKLSRRIR